MSRAIAIFLKDSRPVAELAGWIGSVLGCAFQQGREGSGEFEAHAPWGYLTLGRHDLENDRDLHFEQYPYCLDIQVAGIADGEARDRKALAVANDLFDKLSATNRTDLMLVDDLQRRLRDFTHSDGG